MNREASPAIVLRRWPYSEHSLTLRALTPEHGVLPLLAKGAYRPTSGYLGVLDTWALVELEFGGPDEAELLTVYGAELVHRFSAVSEDAGRLAAAATIAELAELAAPRGIPAPEVFRYLVESLRVLEEGPPLRAFLCRRLLDGLELLGLQPQLEGAAPTGRKNGGVWFSPAAGGVVPSTERPEDGRARRVPSATLAWLRNEAPAPPEAEQDACLTILGDFLHYHLERPPRAWPLLRDRRRTLLDPT